MTPDIESSHGSSLFHAEQHPEEAESSRDIGELLRTVESLCRLSRKNPWVPEFFKGLREVLQKYPGDDVQKLIDHLRERSTKTHGRTKQPLRKKYGAQELASMALADVKALISDPDIGKEELLLIGEVQFGLPTGSFRKVKKEDLRSRIRAAMENAETMKIISDRAGR